jgi:formate dehydrogenase maturation protein FdhE
VSTSVKSRRPSTASKTLAEQYQPIVTVHEALRQRALVTFDLTDARARVRAGRPAFETHAVLSDATDLTRSFGRVAASLERTGVASTTELNAMRARALDPRALVLSWANAESMPRNPSLRLARTVASLLGNALLSRASSDVTKGFSLASWKRALCPCCGATPDLALATEKRRTLVCWRCDTMWRTEVRGCLGCGADSSPTLVRVPSPVLGYDLAICNACGRYLKERRGAPSHSLIVERALTAALDEAAEQRGLRA